MEGTEHTGVMSSVGSRSDPWSQPQLTAGTKQTDTPMRVQYSENLPGGRNLLWAI